MEIILVRKTDDIEYIVLLMQHKISREWSYVNLTKQHICPCKFKTYEEAIEDLNKQVKDGKVISYKIINEPIKFHFSYKFKKGDKSWKLL